MRDNPYNCLLYTSDESSPSPSAEPEQTEEIVPTQQPETPGEMCIRDRGEYCEFSFWLPDSSADKVPSDKSGRFHE